MNSSAADSASQVVPPVVANLIDRRQQSAPVPGGMERRQFASSYGDLSEEARQLALAIDTYKLQHRRRYLSFEEMIQVIKSLGYSK
jgi:hypothetical protein